MKGLLYHGVHEINFAEIPDPKLIHPQDAIVKVGVATICGSDLHIYHGREKEIDRGTVMGHEITGEIVSVGKEVQRFKVGDRVVSPFSSSCGQCHFCETGLPSRCLNGELFGWRSEGEGLHGGQAEYTRIPFADGTLCHIGSLPYEQAVLTACNLGTGWYAAEQAEATKAASLGVIGCGAVGLLAILAAKAMGVGTVYAFDAVPERMEIARRYGAIPIDYRENPIAQVKDLNAGAGLAACIEAVGSGAALRLAYELLQPGGIISAVGVDTGPSFSITPEEAYDKNITYRVGRCPAKNYIPALVEALLSGKLKVGEVLTHRCHISTGQDCYKNFSERKDGIVKVLMDF